MKLDIAKFKNAETNEFWLHIKKPDGSLDYADNHTQEEIDEYNERLAAYTKGRKPALRECVKPFRMKFRSVHSQSYESALARATFKAAAKRAQAKERIGDVSGITTGDEYLDKASDVAVESLLLSDNRWREIIVAACIGWENLTDSAGNKIEFSAEVLHYIIYPQEHYHIFAQIREALNDQLNFMQESQTQS